MFRVNLGAPKNSDGTGARSSETVGLVRTRPFLAWDKRLN
jgi:hypothetical protein